MKESLTNPLSWLASLRLTVLLLAMGMYLIFVGTLAQVEEGIWQVVRDYFRSMYVSVPFDVFRPILMPGSETPWRGAHWFPGGFAILGALVINLIAAHAARFKVKGKGTPLLVGYMLLALGTIFTGYTVLEPKTSATIQQNVLLMLAIWAAPMLMISVGCLMIFGTRKAGIVIVHSGLILMLLGEFVTGLSAKEGQMWISEFGSSNVIVDVRSVEIAFVADAGEGKQKHVVVTQGLIESADAEGEKIVDGALPLSVRIDAWMPNSDLRHSFQSTDPTDITWQAEEIPTVTGTEQRADRPSVMATFFEGDKKVGQHLLSTWEFVQPVPIMVGGERWQVSLRFHETHLPYSLQLHDFSNDLFTGTGIARNYSSDLRLQTASGSESRDAYIKMNEPLRYDGKAFFQAGFFQQPMNRNLGTILQVADNPGAWVPYLSCVVVTVGLMLHFVLSLVQFGRRFAAQSA